MKGESHPSSYRASSSGRRKIISGVEPESDRNKEELCEGASSSAGLRRSGRADVPSGIAQTGRGGERGKLNDCKRR